MSAESISALCPPATDPSPIFEAFRGSYGTELLTAAVAHFNLFNRLASGPKSPAELQAELGLERRPMIVLTTTLRAFGLLAADAAGRLSLTDLSREHLTRDSRFDVSDYVGLAADSPGVREMVTRLRTNRPAGADDGQGAAFIYRDGLRSAMDHADLARHFTLALAGRAKNVAPLVAERLPVDGAAKLLDLGGGTGIYSLALLQKHPRLTAVIVDHEEVLKIAGEFACEHGVADRVELRPGDMFRDPLPRDCQLVLLSNILHDWDEPQCAELIRRCAEALPSGGRLAFHDVFLNDELDGPLPIALYSAALFTLTEGRAYSRAEYRRWLIDSGLVAAADTIPTLIHCGLLIGRKP